MNQGLPVGLAGSLLQEDQEGGDEVYNSRKNSCKPVRPVEKIVSFVLYNLWEDWIENASWGMCQEGTIAA